MNPSALGLAVVFSLAFAGCRSRPAAPRPAREMTTSRAARPTRLPVDQPAPSPPSPTPSGEAPKTAPRHDPRFRGRPLSLWIADLDDRDPATQAAALAAIVGIGGDAVVAADRVYAMWLDGSAELRGAAADALVALGSAGATRLVRLVRDGSPELQVRALVELDRIPGHEALVLRGIVRLIVACLPQLDAVGERDLWGDRVDKVPRLWDFLEPLLDAVPNDFRFEVLDPRLMGYGERSILAELPDGERLRVVAHRHLMPAAARPFRPELYGEERRQADENQRAAALAHSHALQAQLVEIAAELLDDLDPRVREGSIVLLGSLGVRAKPVLPRLKRLPGAADPPTLVARAVAAIESGDRMLSANGLRELIDRNEIAAIKALESIAVGQAGFKSRRVVDQDHDGEAEYGWLGELAGASVCRG